MASYRDNFREVHRDFYWSLPRVAGVLFVGLLVLGAIGFGVKMLLTPATIASRTFDANNVIAKYEWFYDAYGNWQARTSQVRQFKGLLAGESDKQEQSRLRIEMAAIQQSCRDLTRRYNANAEKANQSIFMGRRVPSFLDAGECE